MTAVRRFLRAVAFASLTPCTSDLVAQAVPRDAFTLEDAVRLARERSQRIRQQLEQQDASRGVALSAAEPFATQWTGSAYQQRQGSWQLANTTPTPITADTRDVQIGAERRLRSGLTLQPSLGVTRTDPGASGPQIRNNALRLDFILPLASGFGGGSLVAQERAAVAIRRSDELRSSSIAAETLRDATLAYWNYVGAELRRIVFDSSQARAHKTEGDMRQLVAAGERPAADLGPVLASVAAKRAARLAAEQEMSDARRQVGTVIGLEADETLRLPTATTALPQGQHLPADGPSLQKLAAAAAAGRPDVVAVAHDASASEVLLRGAQNELRPRIDLNGSLAYTRVDRTVGISSEPSTLRNAFPGTSVSLGVSYQQRLHNVGAEGREVQLAAVARQLRRAHDDAARTASIGVLFAGEAMRRGADVLEQNVVATELQRSAVENARIRYRSGDATIIDLLVQEDALISSRLSEVGARLAYARALAVFRFETGALGVSTRSPRAIVLLLTTTAADAPLPSP